MTSNVSHYTMSAPPYPKRIIKTALHQAVLDCRIHQVRLLVSKHAVNVDCKDLHGRTPLMLACLIDDKDHGYRMAKIFLKVGCYVNARDNMGRTAFSYACMNGREDIVRKMLKEEVLDINEPDTDGNTALHHSAVSGNPNIVELIIEAFERYGLNVDGRNSLGYTSLLLACRHGHYTSAYLLLKKGHASPTLRDNECFLNALEWVQRSRMPGLTITPRRIARPKRVPIMPPFTDDTTFYHRPITPVCRHTTSRPNPLSWSTGSILRLPSIIMEQQSLSNDGSETFFQGQESRALLLEEIQNAGTKPRRFSAKTGYTRMSHPPTAKLLALDKHKRRPMYHDMQTIFQAYSEQYDPYIKKAEYTETVEENIIIPVSEEAPAVLVTSN